jgi:hypothetical protein
MPNYAAIHRWIALPLVRLGRIDEARAAVQRMLQLDPGCRLGRIPIPFRDQAFVDELRRAWRLARLPE